ncbi:MAG: type II toxin-antitoxin system RelE/ParE family toxin [Micrococcales bacterium]|nr:type II toxin-antitoxin system RelE/ParE family toxin [Micrococcales bacterium]
MPQTNPAEPAGAPSPEARYRLSQAAQADILQILAWSSTQFGQAARERYQALIAAALRDIAERRDGPGSTARPELGPGVLTWHLRQSRARSTGGNVHRPRHFVVFRIDTDTVIVGRVLHDSMELRHHLDALSTWTS